MPEPTTTTPALPLPLHPGIFEEDASGERRLVGTRCRQCGAHFFPRRTVCARCLSEETEIVPLSRQGTLHTFTVVHQSTPEFRTPYILAYADLPEGVRLLAPLAGVEPDRITVGMPLSLRVEPVRTDAEGRPILGYRWYAVPEVPHG